MILCAVLLIAADILRCHHFYTTSTFSCMVGFADAKFFPSAVVSSGYKSLIGGVHMLPFGIYTNAAQISFPRLKYILTAFSIFHTLFFFFFERLSSTKAYFIDSRNLLIKILGPRCSSSIRSRSNNR